MKHLLLGSFCKTGQNELQHFDCYDLNIILRNLLQIKKLLVWRIPPANIWEICLDQGLNVLDVIVVCSPPFAFERVIVDICEGNNKLL